MPNLAGTYFGDSLIYLCEHNAEGAMGLIVNRECRLELADVAEALELPKPPPNTAAMLVEGGPVSPEQGFVLHSDNQQFADSQSIAPGIMLASSRDAVERLMGMDAPAHAIIALGYSGWGPGQLEQEIEDDAWLTVEASRSILFGPPLEARLHQAAAQLGIDMRLMARQTGHA